MNYFKFIEEVLAKTAHKTLLEFYKNYNKTDKIEIDIKSDKTPASIADRQTEKKLRALIKKQFPDHGIWGEEFGAFKINSEYLWVLDPLDGTKEFLSKKPNCFGTLIGLMQEKNVVAGAIISPFENNYILSNKVKRRNYPIKQLNKMKVACTNPNEMFYECFVESLKNKTDSIITNLNCIGITKLIKGEVDIFLENDLSLHDIVPTLPILLNAGIKALDLEGNNYYETKFNLGDISKKKYGIIATASEHTAEEILNLYCEGL